MIRQFAVMVVDIISWTLCRVLDTACHEWEDEEHE